MATRICIDVDLTLVDEHQQLRPGAVQALKTLKEKGYLLTLWSYCGEAYARSIGAKPELANLFDGYAAKPDLAIDDESEAISRLPVIDALDSKGAPRSWTEIADFTTHVAEQIDARQSFRTVPPWIQRMEEEKSDIGVQSAMAIWEQREAFIRWPKHARLLLEGVVKHPDGSKQDCYDYSKELVAELAQAGLPVDRRNNGPAILSFKLAGGDRPTRPYPSSWGWTIHHIYDGQFPGSTNLPVPHAIREPQLFTEAAGLVAVHPLADYVARDTPLLAWLLRWEAFRRFKFDPMNVFH